MSIRQIFFHELFFLQHVFHDDLIPLFFTMKYLCYGDARECLKKYQVSDFKWSYSNYGVNKMGHYSLVVLCAAIERK